MILKVKQFRLETKDCFSLILEKPKGFSFYPGQYLDVELPIADPNGSTRAFTISSSPTENYLMHTTKKGISPFKKFMENIKPGKTVSASHPAGTFTLDETEEAIFVAGSIGITPFRSMLKYIFDNKLSTPITLIYSNSDEDFPFKKDLNNWQKQLPNLKVIYHISKISGRLNKQGLLSYLQSTTYPLQPIYYLAGPPKMIDDLEKILIEIGVDSINIRIDRFDGY